ncbi:MAG: hypothetical protein ACRCYO_16655 [Bacteroidia bacterium]
MTKFLFVTHLTPKHKRTALRQALIDGYVRGLEAQTYPHWKVLQFGDEESVSGKFHTVFLPDSDKAEKFKNVADLLQRADVKALFDEADYVLKLDDDDLISPTILEEAAGKNFDCWLDRWHTFFDLSSGQITQQNRPWIAACCIHKKEHALAAYTGEGDSPVGNLLYTDHSKAWHVYYEGKNCIISDRTRPVYLRILSPSSITAGAQHGPPKHAGEVNFEKYYAYLRLFGNWENVPVKQFDAYRDQLREAWRVFSLDGWKPIPDEGIKGWLKKMGRRIKRMGKKSCCD